MSDSAGDSANAGQSPDDELTIPRAAVNKYIKEVCPNIRVGFETRELLLQCCSEFIHVISTEANQICNDNQKKTITAEHILKALDTLGFGDYVAEAETVLKDCKAQAAKKRRKSTRLENLGISEEELLRQQQELFAKAREEQLIVDQQRWAQMQQQALMAEQLQRLKTKQTEEQDGEYDEDEEEDESEGDS